mgnify:FL=1|jgi:hypothetical protein
MPQSPIAQPPVSDNDTRLATRYGHTKRSQLSRRSMGVLAGLVFAAVLGAWLWWGGVLETPAQLQYRDIGHTIISDTSVETQYEITTAPGTRVSCALQALNSSFGIVGWQVVEIDPSSEWTRVFQTTLNTSESAVTGLLYQCWLP